MSMNNENAETTEKAKRIHDQAPSDVFAEFMRSGWAPSDFEGLEPLEVVTYAFARRQVLSAAFPGIRLVLPAGVTRFVPMTPITNIDHTVHSLTTAACKVLIQLLMLFW
jgi:hypothetical protein